KYIDYNYTSFSNKVFYPHEIAVKHIENKKRNRGIKFISEEKQMMKFLPHYILVNAPLILIIKIY
ncbi:MAG: hypothetical protein ABL929_05110, partial [Ferruginibacter sp.]